MQHRILLFCFVPLETKDHRLLLEMKSRAPQTCRQNNGFAL